MNPRASAPGRRGIQKVTLSLGILTTVTVLATTTLAAFAAFPQPNKTSAPTPAPTPTPTIPASPETTFPDGQIIYGPQEANIYFEVPADYNGWKSEGSGTIIFLTKPNGDPDVKVHHPVTYNSGVCATNGDSTSQAYVGVTAVGNVADATLETSQDFMMRRWTNAVRRGGGAKARTSTPETVEVTTKSGLPALRSWAQVRGAAEECEPPKTEIWLESVQIGSTVTTIVLRRDVGVPNGLSRAEARAILDTIDAEVPPS